MKTLNNIDKNITGENPKADVERMSRLLKKGFTIILSLILLLAILNILELQKTKKQLNEIVSINIKKMALSSIMLDSIRLRTIILYKMLGTDDYFERDELLSELYNSAKQFREARAKTIALGVPEIEKEINDNILAIVTVTQPMSRDAAESMLSNLPYAELSQKVQNVSDGQDKLYDLLNRLNALHKDQSYKALEDVNKNFTYTVNLTLLVTFIVIYLCVVVAIKIYRHVINTSNILTNKNIELKKSYVKSEEATKTKSEFLAKMSHETRTPMNGIMGMLQLLQTTDLNTEQKDYTETALSSGHSLLKIIDDILDFSKIESGILDVEKASFNLISTLYEVINSFTKPAYEKNIKLNCSIQEDIDEEYIGDQIRISQILMNLTDNAIKFSKDGEVKINVSVKEKQNKSSLLYFEVCDSGIGIPDDVKEQLFTAFNQADNSIQRTYDGTGLGLSICKKLISLMGGEIGIQDSEGGGSIFWFTLELETI